MFMQNLIARASTTMWSMDWSVESFLGNVKDKVTEWGGLALMVLGAVSIIYGVYQLITGLMSHGKKQTNWFIVAGTIVVGGAFFAGGWGLAESLASGGENIIKGLGETIMLFPRLW